MAYLFVCGMDVDDEFEERGESEFLQLYMDELAAYGVGGEEGDGTPLPTLDGLRAALDLAYCDLYWWMLGWGVWGNGFLEDCIKNVIDGM